MLLAERGLKKSESLKSFELVRNRLVQTCRLADMVLCSGSSFGADTSRMRSEVGSQRRASSPERVSMGIVINGIEGEAHQVGRGESTTCKTRNQQRGDALIT